MTVTAQPRVPVRDRADPRACAGLAAAWPDLEPTLALLRREHEEIAALLAELQALVRAEADAPDPARALAEVDRLAEALEAHLTREEHHLIPALDALPPLHG